MNNANKTYEMTEIGTSGERDMDDVIIEIMPGQHRASHRAARNWGRYPANGAERYVATRVEAENRVQDDPDGYDHIVRDAEDGDLEQYGKLY